MAEFTPEILKIIERNERTAISAENEFYNELPAIEKKVYDELKKLFNDFNTKDGKIEFDAANVDIVNQVDERIKKAIKATKYGKAAAGYLRNFETLKENNVKLHSELNGLDAKELDKLVNPIQKAIVEQTLQGLTGTGVSTNFIEPVREGIYKNIVAGATIADLENALQTYILGNPNVNGLFSRYVKQVSRDALNQFDGQVNARIAEENGLDAFRYVGSLIDDSRPQCRRWVSMGVLQKDDLPAQIMWAQSNGTGMIPGTNAENFAVYRGGYNCRHAAIPFKLTKSQREKLGMEQKAEEKKEATTTNLQIAEIKKANKQTTQQQKKVANKKELNEGLFVSTQAPGVNKKFIDLVNEQNGAAEIAEEFKTVTGLLNSTESKNTWQSSKLFENKPLVNKFNTIPMGPGVGGICARNNTGCFVKILKGQQIIGRGYDKEFTEILGDTEKYLKDNNFSIGYTSKGTKVASPPGSRYAFFTFDDKTKQWRVSTISSITEVLEQNIAPTITHEFGHLIHNKYDKFDNATNQRNKIVAMAKKLGVKLNDAPSDYGASNWSEFWAESFSAYVYTPKWFETNYNKAFNLFESLLNEYGIDKNTIQQFK